MLDRSSIVNWGRGDKEFKRNSGPYSERRNIPLLHTPEGGFVTVCVAAICGGSTVFGASDRMITAWTTEFEPADKKEALPPPLKIMGLSNSIVAMIAGDDMSLLSQLIYDLRHLVNKRIVEEPKNWWSVSDVAHMYKNLYLRKKNQLSEQKVLVPRGMTMQSFTKDQHQFDGNFLLRVDSELTDFKLPSLSVIFAGVDPSGPHLYVVRNDEVSCEDLVGFAAIGSGYWHAESTFMAQGHTKYSPLPRTAYLTYAAKKRAENAPGVGGGTDMFTIGPELGSLAPIFPNILEEFDKTYKKAQKSARKVWESEEKAMEALIAKLTQEAQQKAKTGQKPEGPGPTGSGDGTTITS